MFIDAPEVFRRFYDSAGFALQAHAAFACYVGSKAHNTHVPKEDPTSIDDVDVTVIVVPPPERVYGLNRWSKSLQIQHEEWDVTVHSLDRFVELALKGNPNILCTLWGRPDNRLHVAPWFQPVLDRRSVFSSRSVVSSFRGYAHDQLHKMDRSQAYQGYMGEKRKALVDRFGYDVKNAAHLVRLLRMCLEFVTTAEMHVWRDADADEIRAVKTGRWTLARVNDEAARLFAAIDAALPTSPLPKEPERGFANVMLLTALHAAWGLPARPWGSEYSERANEALAAVL